MVDFAPLLNTPKRDIYAELFKRGHFDFITVSSRGKNLKQELALELLVDSVTREVAFGGAAGPGKSWIGCSWLLFMCTIYPGTRWFIGREELKRLRESTLITFFKVCKEYQIVFGQHVKYNAQDHYLDFSNGSRIDLLELKLYPTDPTFDRFGSLEYTGGFIDEAGEITFAAYDTIRSRCGRQFNDKYGITPKIFVTFNPKKNFVDTRFYRPFKAGTLPPEIRFIPALIGDNPHVESQYRQQLESLSDPVQKQRLLYGNFDYSDDPADLCDYDSIKDLFTNDHVQPTGLKYLSADLAMQGRDRFVAGSWNGLVCTVAIDKAKATGKEIENDLKELMIRDHIPHSKVIVDSDGLGAYLESYLEGISSFHGGARAVNRKEFANLKSECGFKLAELINKREIKIICSPQQKEMIIQELGVLKRDSVDHDDSRKRIVKKELMKEYLSRSPDYLDMILMRMYFVLKPEDYLIYSTSDSPSRRSSYDDSSDDWSIRGPWIPLKNT